MNILPRLLYCSATFCHGLTSRFTRPAPRRRLRFALVTAVVACLGSALACAQTYIVTITQGNNQSAEVGTNYAQFLDVTVTDSSGHPVRGVGVEFSCNSQPKEAGAHFEGNASLTIDTDSSGHASSGTVTANSVAGSFFVTVKIGGTGYTSFLLTNTAGPAAKLTVTTPDSEDTDIPIKCTVVLTDAYGNIVQAYDVIDLSSTDPKASLPNPVVLDGATTFTATLNTPGNQTITAKDITPGDPFTGVSSAIDVTQSPNFVVTSNKDEHRNASNCTPQSSPGTGSDVDCELGDALAGAQDAGRGAVTFDSKVFNPANSLAANTIVLTAGPLTIPTNTSITGAYTGVGISLSPVVTISGNNTSGVFQQTNASGLSVINGLTIANGYSASGAANATVGGAGISVAGTFFLNNSVVENNSVNTTDPTGASAGAGIVNRGNMTLNGDLIRGNKSASNGTAEGGGAWNGAGGTLTLVNSTFLSNQAVAAATGAHALGGGIYNSTGKIAVDQSTLALNSATGPAGGSGNAQGGGVFNAGQGFFSYSTLAQNSATAAGKGWGGGVANTSALFLSETTISANSADSGGGVYNKGNQYPANSIISGNTASSSPDLLQAGTTNDNGGNQIGVSDIWLAPLGNYGGPTQTMIPMPGGPPICGGVPGNVGGFQIFDQRGFPNINDTYMGSPCADSGSVQTAFALNWSMEPPSSVLENATFHVAVTLVESGGPFTPTVQIPLTLSPASGMLTGGSASTASGVAHYTLNIGAAGDGYTLNSTLILNGLIDLSLKSSSNEFDVTKFTPTLTWTAPAAITYGTALSATQLDATANVPGTFVYSPAAGYVLSAGTHSLMATFTPTDTTDYNTAKAARSITVNQAAPTLTWAKPANIAYGTPLSATQLDAKANVAGTFVYSPAAGTVLHLGASTLTVTFTPTNTTDYTTAKATIGIWVSPATPAITWKTPANITYGTALSATQLDSTANVPGTFVYSPAAGTVLSPGTKTLTVTFTPTDTVHYAKTTGKVSLMVLKATPDITWTKPANITYGTALSATQLDATASVPGTFVYSPASGTVLSAGSNTLAVSFSPTNTADYNTAKATLGIWVYQAAPTITWATPAPISAGTALSATQLDAAVTGVDGKTLAGTSTYSPAAGTVLAAGKHTLTVTFTPTSSNYKKATASVTLTVQ